MVDPSQSRVLRFAISAITGAALVGAAAIAAEPPLNRNLPVTGSGTDLLNGTVVHSKKPTPTGMVQKGTEIIELTGDLTGKILYHVTTIIDNQKGTLTNRGDQVFSGTILGSDPVMLHDSRFHFQVNLATGADSGSVYLDDHIAGPRVKCELNVTGTGKASDGNPTFNYTGTCRFGSPAKETK